MNTTNRKSMWSALLLLMTAILMLSMGVVVAMMLASVSATEDRERGQMMMSMKPSMGQDAAADKMSAKRHSTAKTGNLESPH